MSEDKKLSNAELQAEIARLQEALAGETVKRTEAEEMAAAMSQAGQFIAGAVEEQPTGKTVTVNICLNPTERNEKKQKFKDIELPTFYYTIQLPTGAGLALSTNGIEFYHGETYEFDSITLAEMKSRVARCWEHEKSIHGDNENAYRRPTNQHFGIRKGR
jgi:hypothetical protein